MVNIGFSWGSFIGIVLAVAGASLYFLRSVRPGLARDYDIFFARSEEHTSELQSLTNLVCRLLLEKKKTKKQTKKYIKKVMIMKTFTHKLGHTE